MPKVNQVKKAQKEKVGTCSCGHSIVKGDSYKWIKFRYGGKRFKCVNCNFRSSELTQSKRGEFYAAQENAEDAIGAWDGEDGDALVSIIDDLKGEVESLRDECESSLDSMPENLQESSPSAETLREYIEGAEEWEGELDNVDIEEFDPEEYDGDCPKCGGSMTETAKDDDNGESDWECDAKDCDTTHHHTPDTSREDWADTARSAVEEAIGACPL